jgi:hypothetical protein
VVITTGTPETDAASLPDVDWQHNAAPPTVTATLSKFRVATQRYRAITLTYIVQVSGQILSQREHFREMQNLWHQHPDQGTSAGADLIGGA